MNRSKFLGLLVFAGTFGSVSALATSAVVPAAATTTSSTSASTQTICQSTASAARSAARRDAQAEYWITIAKCFNAPGFGDCEDEAEDVMEEAFDLADEQYHARLEVCQLVGQGAYNPQINPNHFSPDVTNPYFRLVPGRKLVYEKMTDEGRERVEVTTLHGTIEINGVECRRVRDVVTLDGEFVEDTVDFYAQKNNGDAWYFGEVVQNFEDGFLDNLDGSWRFGKDGAKPGIVMLADRDPNDAYRQEFLIGEAEDIVKVLSTNQTVHVAAGTFHNCVKTKDWTPIEPDKFEYKYYAAGIGLVLEVDPETNERLELIQIVN